MGTITFAMNLRNNIHNEKDDKYLVTILDT